MLLALHSLLSLISYRTEDPLPRGSVVHAGLHPLTVINGVNASQTCRGSVGWRQFLAQDYICPDDTSCAKLTKIKQNPA